MRTHTIALLLVAACGGTPEARVSFDVSIRGVVEAGATNEHGYVVALEEAQLRVAGVHFYEGEPVFGARRSSWSDGLAYLTMMPARAEAHPGHYTPGAALGELLTPVTADLMAPAPVILGRSEGVTGAYRSARIDLAPDGGVTASLRGTARTGTVSIDFVAEVGTTARLEGLAFRNDIDSRGGAATIEVSLRAWTDRVDFSEVERGATATRIEPGSRAHNALTRGVEDLAGFRVIWETP